MNKHYRVFRYFYGVCGVFHVISIPLICYPKTNGIEKEKGYARYEHILF